MVTLKHYHSAILITLALLEPEPVTVLVFGIDFQMRYKLTFKIYFHKTLSGSIVFDSHFH